MTNYTEKGLADFKRSASAPDMAVAGIVSPTVSNSFFALLLAVFQAHAGRVSLGPLLLMPDGYG